MGEVERELLLPKRDARGEEDRGEVRGDEEASRFWPALAMAGQGLIIEVRLEGEKSKKEESKDKKEG